jgi:hypothetical protein
MCWGAFLCVLSGFQTYLVVLLSEWLLPHLLLIVAGRLITMHGREQNHIPMMGLG